MMGYLDKYTKVGKEETNDLDKGQQNLESFPRRVYNAYSKLLNRIFTVPCVMTITLSIVILLFASCKFNPISFCVVLLTGFYRIIGIFGTISNLIAGIF